MRISALILLTVITAFSCRDFSHTQQEPVARTHEEFLYRDDLAGIFPPNISGDDSIKIARRFIDKWIRNQLLLELAELNLPPEEKNVDKQIASFRASLLIHKYRQHLILQKMDTVISMNEISKYYEDHINNFILERPVITGIYFRVPLSSPDRDRVLSWFRNESSSSQLENFIARHAESHLWFKDEWIYPDHLAVNMPAGSFNSPADFSGRDHITVNDSEYQYFIGITDYLAPGSQMPFSLASRKIKSIILNQRKIQFLNKLEKSVMTEASSKSSYQYF